MEARGENAQPREYHHDDLNCSIQNTIKRRRSRTLVILRDVSHEFRIQRGRDEHQRTGAA